MSHTPGPWTCFYKHKYDEWHVSLPVPGSSMKVALCSDGIQSNNREADAHLIAAAPDMLHALLGLQVIAEQHVTDMLADIQEGRVVDPVLQMEIARWQAVHAAIAKATNTTSETVRDGG